LTAAEASTNVHGLVPAPHSQSRSMGLLGATGVGVGAIVGGGILVLAGAAFEATGPGALAAFALNGVVAALTALSFAEMSTTFPESGGAYVFAKKVLSVRAAFAVGWILWFAYIVAGVLYALGFAEFAVAIASDLWFAASGEVPPALVSRRTVIALALAAVGLYTVGLIRKSSGGGQWATVGKVVVFAVVIVAGLWALPGSSGSALAADLTPFLANGNAGLLRAMGFTFIALQGFEVIAAVAGEVREPSRTLPRAMFLSLGVSLLIYLPLLFVVITAGTPEGQKIAELSATQPETVIPRAVKGFMGPTGYWLVMIAAVLSTLSALQANILAASRVALTMAVDRTLPRVLAERHATRMTPVMAIYASALALVAILFMVPNLASAGAAASLIFLVSFALAHWTSYLARRRAGGARAPFSTPWFPAVPVIGGSACALLAIHQGLAVPAAGAIAAVWLGLGVILYFALFASRAEAVDASVQARDPHLARLRGLSPLVLVPVANPDSASAMIGIANALAPPSVGRVLLLSVVRKTEPGGLDSAERVLSEAIRSSLASGHSPEALLTIAAEPWSEIARVAESHRCESLLLGLSRVEETTTGNQLENLINEVDSDVAVLRARPGWKLESAERILVPVGGRGGHDELRARLLGSLCRGTARSVTFARILPCSAGAERVAESERSLRRVAEEEAPGQASTRVVQSDDLVGALVQLASEHDLLVLGIQRLKGRRAFGRVALAAAARNPAATILISRRA
jgi:basic amino acid/polyamine antiporter, APA family